MGFIYKITNLENGKSYIGQTTRTVQSRWNQHIENSVNNRNSMLITKAIQKYGENNFEVQTLEECENEKLDLREQYWIDFYDTINLGYNSELGGVRGSKKKVITDKLLINI